MRITRHVYFDVNGQIVIGKIKKHHNYGYQFYPQLDTLINRMNEGSDEKYWSVYKINKLIEGLEEIKDILAAQEVASELAENGNGEIIIESQK